MTEPNRNMRLTPTDEDPNDAPSASTLALGQANAAIEDLHRKPSDYLHLPWPTP